MSTALEKGARVHAWTVNTPPGRPVVLAGAGLILVQLVFRGWAVAGAWFQFDDFAFMSRVMNAPLHQVLLEPYAGHVMPGGMLLTWLNHHVAPLGWALPAAELLLMQALASVGCLVFLVSAFGARWAILPPLAVYLFSVISLPAFIWWAAGVNQLPMQIAFFWGLLAHLAYLRTRRPGYAALTMLVTVAGLAFYEKTLLLFPVYAIVALGYFTRGPLGTRLALLWRHYRPGVVGYGVVAVGYTVFYSLWGLNFSFDNPNDQPLATAAQRLAVRGFATGVLGGPLRWDHPSAPFATAAPSDLVVIVACAALLGIGIETVRSRRRAKRAWSIPALVLAADILLVVTGRSVVPAVAQDYRYQTEMAAAAAVGLALSLLPLLGAVESAERKRRSAFFDNRSRVTAATAGVVCLALVSSTQFTRLWQAGDRPREYFDRVEEGLASSRVRVPLVDVAVPDYMLWGFGYPENATSHVLRMFARHTRYPTVATDRLFVVADNGRIAPVAITPVRQAEPGPTRCGYLVEETPVLIPLDGPVLGRWWVRIGYLADGDSPVTVTAGESTHDTWVFKGLHSLYFQAEGRFRTIELSGLEDGVRLCTAEVTLGVPVPVPLPVPQAGG